VFLVSAGLAFLSAAASLARGPGSRRGSKEKGGPVVHAEPEADLVGVVPGGGN
jgi:hypothetical protein